jgi:hypothetical protein
VTLCVPLWPYRCDSGGDPPSTNSGCVVQTLTVVSSLTQADAMAIFGFTDHDLLANRRGLVTWRQRARLVLHEGFGIGAFALACSVAGTVSAYLWILTWVDPPDGLLRQIEIDRDLSFLPYVALLGVLGLAISAALARDLVLDVMQPQVQLHVGVIHLGPGTVSMRYHAIGTPTGRTVEVSSAGTFPIGLSESRRKWLIAVGTPSFSCVTYRTAGGLRLLSVDVAQAAPGTESPHAAAN